MSLNDARRLLAVACGIEVIYLIAVLGQLSIFTHGNELTDLGRLTGYRSDAALAVTGGILALFTLYGAGITIVRHGRPGSRRIVLGATIVFSLTVVGLYPATAMDVYNYAVQGYVIAQYSINPLVMPPGSIEGDPYISYAGSWATSPSPYGPLWLLVSTLVAYVAGSNVLTAVVFLKLLAAGAVIATTAILGNATRNDWSGGSWAMLLFGWNPLVQLELVGNGHNDAAMILLIVVALVLAAGRRPELGALALAGSILVKYLTVEVLPFFLVAQLVDGRRTIGDRVGQVGRCVVVLALAAYVIFAPFWAGPTTLERLRGVDDNYLSSFTALAILVNPGAIDWLIYPRLAIAVTIVLWQLWALLTAQTTLARSVFEVMFVTLLIANHFAGWYLPLLLATAVLSDCRWREARLIALTLTTSLATPLWSYGWQWGQPWLSLAQFHFILIPLTFAVPLALTVAQVWHSSGQHLGSPLVGKRRGIEVDG